jgi:hypothetical protein
MFDWLRAHNPADVGMWRRGWQRRYWRQQIKEFRCLPQIDVSKMRELASMRILMRMGVMARSTPLSSSGVVTCSPSIMNV